MSNNQQQEFIASIAPHAQELQSKYGVPASIAIAQAALESGWGKKAAGNNFYGVKGSANGSSVEVATHEFLGGVRRAVTDNFRAYSSAFDSMEDYGHLLASKARYVGVVQASSANEAADALQRAGYATDPRYAEKLKAIIADNDLTRFDDPSYKGYMEGARFAQTRQRLQQERESNPGVWNNFMSFFTQILTVMFSGFGSKISGGEEVASTTAHSNLPRIVSPKNPTLA